MTEALAERDILKQRHATYTDLTEAGTISRSVVTRSEVRFKSTIDVAAVQKQADLLARTIRELDARIQEVNWQVSLQD